MLKIIMKICFVVLLGSKVYADANPKWLTNSIFNVKEISIKKGLITTLHFETDVAYAIAGDESLVAVKMIDKKTLFLHPIIANKITNLNVATKGGGEYVFMLNILDFNSKKEPNLHINISSNHQFKKNILDKLNKRNPAFDYNFNMYSKTWCGFFHHCDYKKIAPRKIWTDGQYTYLDYRTTDNTFRTIPNIQEVVDDIDVPVNKTIKDNIIIVHTLAKKITIIANGAYVCIEYKGKKYEIK